jgi:hypothetical protein
MNNTAKKIETAQHTPGPWSSNYVNPHCIQIRAKKGNTEFECSTAILGGWDTTAEENIANARLIAAAPDLGDALIVAEEMLTNIMRGEQYPTNEYMDNLIQIRAAIARAKGE